VWAIVVLLLVPTVISVASFMVKTLPANGYGWMGVGICALAWIRYPRQRRRLLLYGGGWFLQFLAFPEPDLGFLGFFLLFPYLMAREQDDGANWWRAAFFYGFFRSFFGYYWLGNILYTHWLSVSFLSALSFAVCFETVLRKATFLPFGWRAATGYALFEWVHSWIGGGFPWLFVAHSQHAFLSYIQVVELVGTYALSAVMVFLQASAFRVFRDRSHGPFWRRGGVEFAVAAGLSLACLLYGFVRLPDDIDTGKTVLLIQPSYPLELKEKMRAGRQDEMLEDLIQLTLRGLKAHPETDLIVWPETMHPYIYLEETDDRRRTFFDRRVRAAARRLRRPVIYGANSYANVERFETRRGHNSAILVDANGQTRAVHKKVRLVPLGEHFLPRVVFPEEWCDTWASWLIDHGYPNNADLEAGERFASLDAGDGLRAAPLICFEALYPDLPRDALAQTDPDFLVCLANFGWYGLSYEQRQAQRIWVFRAVETRTAFLISANGGISCSIAPSGRLLAEGPGVMEEGFVAARIPARLPTPFFARGGAWVLPLVLVVVAGAFVSRVYPGRRR